MCTSRRAGHFKSTVMFPFPANGKAHVHAGKAGSPCGGNSFPFPANGKAHVHMSLENGSFLSVTEFPFPANGKAHVHDNSVTIVRYYTRFPFPANGKAHVHSSSRSVKQFSGDFSFPFPANGKAHVHFFEYGFQEKEGEDVSIPCKRESTCALCRRETRGTAVGKSFHSLQTGKHMCTNSF